MNETERQTGKLREFLQAMLEMKRHIMEIPSGYCYHGAEDYILDRGHEFRSQPLTETELQQVFAAVDNSRRRFQLGDCFQNCQLLLFYDKVKALTYYEGYACGPGGMPVLHAWLSIGDHKVVDLTWRTEEPNHRGRLRDRIIGKIPEGWCYYGVTVPRQDIIQEVLDTEVTHSRLEDWKNGYPLFHQERIYPVEELLR